MITISLQLRCAECNSELSGELEGDRVKVAVCKECEEVIKANAKLPPLLPHDEWVKRLNQGTEQFEGDPQDYGDN